MSNPESLRQMLSPENMQAVLQMQQAMQRLQGTGLVPSTNTPGAAGGGFGGAFELNMCKPISFRQCFGTAVDKYDRRKELDSWMASLCLHLQVFRMSDCCSILVAQCCYHSL